MNDIVKKLAQAIYDADQHLRKNRLGASFTAQGIETIIRSTLDEIGTPPAASDGTQHSNVKPDDNA